MRGDVRAHKRNRRFTFIEYVAPVAVVKVRRRGRNAWIEARQAEYAALIEAWETDCERVTKGHGEEMIEYCRDHPRPTFRQVLKDSRRQTEEEAVA